MGDEDLEREILLLFAEQLRTQIARLHGPIDSVEQAIALHTLKGAAFGVGANRIGEIVRHGEEQIRQHGEVAPRFVDELGQAARETLQFIDEITRA